MDNEIYAEMECIVQKIKKIEDSHFGTPGKPLTDEERKELKELRARLQELKKEDDKAQGLI
jgi:hypothetical protein